MRIFNWVHKRFHHKVPKDGVAENGENTEPEGNTGKDTQGFLSQVSLVDGMDHGWRDGILTIGTFGFDPLKPFINQNNDYTVLESVEDGKESQQLTHGGDDHEDTDHNVCEELNPLMFTTFGHSFEDMGSNSDAIVAEPADVILGIDGVPLTPFEGSNEISAEPGHDETDHLKSKGERITLADLFMADGHDFQSQLDSRKVQPELKKKMSTARTRNGGLAFAKKLIPRVKEESAPIKNVQRLMRRMLKRKIHPADLDVKKSTAAVELISTNVETDASESASLLPIQDLYDEMKQLSDLEHTLKDITATLDGPILLEFQNKVELKRLEVEYLQQGTLWHMTFDYVGLLLARSVFTIFSCIKSVFGVPDHTSPAPSIFSKYKRLDAPPSTLGAAALELQYANIVIVLENLVRSRALMSIRAARDKLYAMLPANMRAELSERLPSIRSATSSLADVAAEKNATMAETIEWLAPLARNTKKWHSKRSRQQKACVSNSHVLLAQTLYYANQQKTEATIMELIVGLQYRREAKVRAIRESNALWSRSCANAASLEDQDKGNLPWFPRTPNQSVTI